MNDDVESSEYDLGTTSISLIRIGNIIQILCSKKTEAKVICKELAEKYKLEQDKFRGT